MIFLCGLEPRFSVADRKYSLGSCITEDQVGEADPKAESQEKLNQKTCPIIRTNSESKGPGKKREREREFK